TRNIATTKNFVKKKKKKKIVYKICCIEGEENGTLVNGCGSVQPKYRKAKGVGIEMEYPEAKDQGEDKRQKFSAQQCLDILSRISDEDCQILGFHPTYCRVDWLIIQVLPVCPPAVRPFVLMDGIRPSQDDITHKLYDILKVNDQLNRQEARGVPEHVLEDLVDLLQFHVTTMIDNEVSGQPVAKQKSGKPIKSFRQRLVGKAGRVRGNLMGKRCDFSARTVIGGDPNLSIDEVGVPRSIACLLTYPERVTKYNLHKMRELVENGTEYPGAKTIIRDDGKQIDLRFVGRTSDMNLEPGYVVERHIQNGDVVLFNRQPSLHKMSMMAHKVKVLPWSTFRLNLSVTTPYNADFDGDEMNLHVPQSEPARAELLHLCLVPLQIVSPQSNRPVMGIVQDVLLGVMKFTNRDTFLERHEVYNLLMWLDERWDGTIPVPAILKPKPLWTGKQLVSIILPEVNFLRTSQCKPDNEKETVMSPSDSLVRVEQGELLCGIIDKRSVGTSQGSLIHIIWNEKGPEVTKQFINALNKLICAFLLIHSSSVGVGDTIASEATLTTIQRTIEKAKSDVSQTIRSARSGQLQRQPGSTMNQTFEGKVNDLLNKAMDEAGKAVRNALNKLNNVKLMADAGSKGTAINLSQIIACVGQQNVQGRRIPNGFTNRTLPHFNKGDLGPEARGFVANSYLQGLTPEEMFFHAMGGREGLVDTAVKTASTGYIQRRLIKAMEDVMVCYDRTVRNSLGDVIQFLYGEDGLDAVHIESQSMPHMLISDEKFKQMYEFDLLRGQETGDLFLAPHMKEDITRNAMKNIALQQELERLKEDRRVFRDQIFFLFDQSSENHINLYLPVNIQRLIWNAQKQFGVIEGKEYSELHPVEIVQMVNELCDAIVVLPPIPVEEGGASADDKLGNGVTKTGSGIGMNGSEAGAGAGAGGGGRDHITDPIRAEAQENATLLFKMLIRGLLASKRVCNEYRLPRAAFSYVIGEIRSKFEAAIAHPGEGVGTIAAQSIGEVVTQMTLNTFHYAGVSSKNVTLGVPRLAELINVAQTVKTPSLTVYLRPDVACDLNKTRDILVKLEHCTLRDIVAKSQIYYDPDPRECVVEEDREFLQYFFDFPDDDTTEFLENCSPWMLRLELDRMTKEDKKIRNAEIQKAIETRFKKEVRCLASNDNAEKLILQIRLMNSLTSTGTGMGGGADDGGAKEEDELMEGEDTFLRKLEENLFADIELRGVKGITKVFMRQQDKGFWDNNTGQWSKRGSEKEWVLDTEGSQLLEVMAVDEVDATRTRSNHVVDMFQVLGVEAARASLLAEIRTVIEFYGIYVNYRHLAVLVDTMTYAGALMSITRHGINRRDTGPLMRCSFEETVEILYEAAHFAMADNLFVNIYMYIHTYGCSENIMLGQMIPMGTGSFDLILDHEMLEKYAVEYTDSSAQDPFFGLQDQFTADMSPSYFTPEYQQLNTPSIDGLKYNAMSPGINTPGEFSPLVGGNSSPLQSLGSDRSSVDYSSDHSESSSYFNTSRHSPSYSSFRGNTTSPNYSPTSPNYSPTSPTYSPTSPTYSPTSPTYSPTSPTYSPTSPTYSPTSPTYSPTSPTYSPTSPNILQRSDI
ncbi:hypothetical protein RFI_24716, partial [Reticulomyxa filosa]